MQLDDVARIVRSELARRGTNPYRAAVDAGLPQDSIRYLNQGRDIRVSRFLRICEALGITLTLGAGRDRPRSVNEPPHSQIAPMPGGMERVTDRRLAELLARIADHWDTLDPGGRRRFAGAIEGNLDLAGAEGGAEVRRVVAYLGWRVIEGAAIDAEPISPDPNQTAGSQ